ncbi:MAG: PCRF domain-containing protein [Phycisphaerales bacterium JB037]
MSTAGSALPPGVAEKLEGVASEYDRLEASLRDPAVLGDHVRVRDLSIRKAALEPIVRGFRGARSLLGQIEELREAVESGADAELAELAREEIPELEARAALEIERVKSLLVNAEDRAVGSVILEIRAGTGGDEAGLWARDLLGIYQRYADRKGWTVEPMELTTDASLGGVRHAVLSVKGEGVWQELSFEAGVHSVKRVPETESQGRIHTSTATVAVLPEPEETSVSIDWEKDVQEHITTSQGPGGQNVNKVATACHLIHLPTGIEVRMQESKSQRQNREKARRLLVARVAEVERQRAQAERSAERRSQIGSGERSEKVRVYRYQDGIVADQRLGEKFQLREVLAGELGGLMEALIEQETARRLAAI